jgi:hypothetical protein
VPAGRGGGGGDLGSEGRTSFLKKRSKKLLVILAAASPNGLGPDSQKFFGSFFQKRTTSLSASKG